MTDNNVPSKDWLEQARLYEQPFTITKDGEAYHVTVEKAETN